MQGANGIRWRLFCFRMQSIELRSPGKVNLLLNILGRREDGFHELETLMFPIPFADTLHFELAGDGIHLSTNVPGLDCGSGNLVHRAAQAFFLELGQPASLTCRLEKELPMEAGLGGGSGNAAVTLLALNDLHGHPLNSSQLWELAARLGSDVPFFLGRGPALATGRGELIEPLMPFPSLKGRGIFCHHPGFGVSTPWVYGALKSFPDALNGRPGRARELAKALGEADARPGQLFYNSLEAPVLPKYPVLSLFQEALREAGAWATMMSGSGSSTFALFENLGAAESAREQFESRFGAQGWTRTALLD